MFKPLLIKMVEKMDGQAIGAILMDKEGISVEKVESGDALDVETAAMGYSVVLKDIFKAAEMIKAGSVSEVFIRSAGYSALMRVLDETYFVALFLKPEGNLGRGRFALRTVSTEIKKEL
jgi:predicted regulator of Ras-like GTPase activity (Roadblock/LC7/MglB family)